MYWLIDLSTRPQTDGEVWKNIQIFSHEFIGKKLCLLNPSKRYEFQITEVSEDFIRVNKLPIKLVKEIFLSVYQHLVLQNKWVKIGASRVNTKPNTIEGLLKTVFFEGNVNALSTAPWISAILVRADIGVEFNGKSRGQAIRYSKSK